MSKGTRNAGRNLSADDMLQIALDMMERLTAAQDERIEIEAFSQEHGISREQTIEILEMLQGLADEQTGSHIALDLRNESIFLSGDAGRLDPVRLTPAESLALRRVLTHCKIPDDVRERVESALCSSIRGAGERGDLDRLMGGDRLLGGFYPIISEAIAFGARLEISYRAEGEDEPRTRIVDPMLIEVSGDAAYLVAWNIEKDAQRSYRLDRIAGAALTDDSIESHALSPCSAAESLRAHGESAELRFKDPSVLALRDWEGIHRDETRDAEDGTVITRVSYTSKPWLFSQIVASGGAIEIVDPTELRIELASWARDLAAR